MKVPEAAEVYLAKKYAGTWGASSKISAVIATRLLAAQTAHGIGGNVGEIGVAEGRFFIALALCLAPGEKAIATDVFTWPDEGIEARFLANCEAAGVEMGSLVVQKVSTQALTPETYRGSTGGTLRFLHVDGAHTHKAVLHDLSLAEAALDPDGVLCLDDVLHPLYPALTVAVTDWLKAHPEFALFAIVDRESFASACKFLVCRRERLEFYQAALAAAAPESLMRLRAQFFGTEALIFAPAATA